MRENSSSFAARISLWIFYGLLAYMPLHILLSTWIGTSFGVLEAMKIAKDVVMVVGFVLALLLAVRQPTFRPLLRDKVVWLIVAYSLLTVVFAAIKPTDSDAELLGVVYNLRFFVFAAYAVLLTRLFDARHICRRAVQIVLAVGALVVVFVLVRQYRHAIGEIKLQFPAGVIDKGESSEQAALRELKEEAGYTTTKPLVYLGRCAPHATKFTALEDFYVALDATKAGEPRYDEQEESEVVLMGEEEIWELLGAKETHMMTLTSGFLLAYKHLNKL